VAQQSPVPDELDRPFWEACNDDRLVLQHCAACAKYRFPPEPRCWACGSDRLPWREVGATGTLYTYAVVHDTPIASLKEDLPYVVGVVEIDDADGVNLVARVRDVPLDAVPVDGRIAITFEPTPGTGQKVPVARSAVPSS